MKLTKVLLALLLFLFSFSAFCNTEYICTPNVYTVITYKKEFLISSKETLHAKSKQSKKDDPKVKLIFSKNKLTLMGNNGKAELHYVGRGHTGGQLYFIEKSLTGNIFLWVFYPAHTNIMKEAVLMQQKSYNMTVPATFTYSYICK